MNTFIKIAVWYITFMTMVAIFMFSAENATQSSNTSGTFTEKVLSISPTFRELPQEEKETVVNTAEAVIRKIAHFTIYTALGFFSYLSLLVTEKKLRLAQLFAVAFSALYAISDEIHQRFSSGRSCQVRDMCIDTCGALCGVLIATLIIFIVKKVSEKRCINK